VDGAQGVPRGQEETDRERTSAADEGQSAGRLGDERWSRGGGEHGGEDQEAGGAVEQSSDKTCPTDCWLQVNRTSTCSEVGQT